MRLRLPYVIFCAALTPAIAFAAGDHFDVTAQRPILDLPADSRPSRVGDISALSPDGKRVLIVRAGRLTIRPLESREETELLPAGSVVAALGAWAAWAPDEKHIYYLRRGEQPGINDLWKLDVASRKTARLIQNVGGAGTAAPLPSPDGKSIAFYRGHTLMIAGADGKNERALIDNGDRWGFSRTMVWSPDSSQILARPNYPRDPKRTNFTQLSLLNVATKQLQPLVAVPGTDYQTVSCVAWPAWSSGPFACVTVLQQNVPLIGTLIRSVQLWHLSLPRQEWTQVTHEPESFYVAIYGAGADGNSLVVQRMPPPPGVFDIMFGFLDKYRSTRSTPNTLFQPTVVLTLSK